MPVLSNVEARWASLQEPNTTYDDAYEVECILTPEQAAELRALALPVKEKDGELSYRFKNKVYGTRQKDGGKFERQGAKPRVVGPDKAPFTDLIGNGSKINVLFDIRTGSYAGNQWVKADMKAVQVVEHVPYSGSEEVSLDAFDTVGATDDDAPF